MAALNSDLMSMRKALGLSQAQIASALGGASKGSVSVFERYGVPLPRRRGRAEYIAALLTAARTSAVASAQLLSDLRNLSEREPIGEAVA